MVSKHNISESAGTSDSAGWGGRKDRRSVRRQYMTLSPGGNQSLCGYAIGFVPAAEDFDDKLAKIHARQFASVGMVERDGDIVSKKRASMGGLRLAAAIGLHESDADVLDEAFGGAA